MPHIALTPRQRAILFTVTAWQIVPFMDGIAKYLGGYYSVPQIVWGRFFFHLLWVLPVVLYRLGPSAFRVPHAGMQIARGGFLLVATLLFFAAIQFIPLATAIGLVFVAPLVVTGLSPILLGEHVGVARWVAVLFGFMAVLIIVRPGLAGFHWASLMALGTAVSFGLYLLTTRRLAGTAPPMVTLAYQSVLGVVVMSVWLGFVWITPTFTHFLLMIALGAIAATGHFLIIKAYELADASMLAPFNYTEIIMATFVGFIFFNEFPDAWTWLGISLVIAAAVYVSLPEKSPAVSTDPAVQVLE